MRNIVQDQVSHNFIEGPVQDKVPMGNFNEGNNEKVAHHADLSQGREEEDEHATMYNTDMPFYWANERYD